jgi:hypothetical protein
MWRCLEKTASHPPFNSLPNLVDLNLKNTAETSMSRLSETFDFSKEDRIRDDLFNMVIWAAIKGFDSPCPAPVHAGFFTPAPDDDDE